MCRLCCCDCGAFAGDKNAIVRGDGMGRGLRILFRGFGGVVGIRAMINRTIRVNSAALIPFISMAFNFNANAGRYATGGDRRSNNNNNNTGVRPDTVLIVGNSHVRLFGVGNGPCDDDFSHLVNLMPSLISGLGSSGCVCLGSRRWFNRWWAVV